MLDAQSRARSCTHACIAGSFPGLRSLDLFSRAVEDARRIYKRSAGSWFYADPAAQQARPYLRLMAMQPRAACLGSPRAGATFVLTRREGAGFVLKCMTGSLYI